MCSQGKTELQIKIMRSVKSYDKEYILLQHRSDVFLSMYMYAVLCTCSLTYICIESRDIAQVHLVVSVVNVS